jgi:hypothetical protein
MRLEILFAVLCLALGCTTQSAGQRCQQDQDCNAAANELCRGETTPTQPCSGSACICCPADLTAAAAVPGCLPTNLATDAGARARD